VERLGAIAKCAPPLRNPIHVAALWEKVLEGTVDLMASDHSPASPEMKCGPFWQAWGGIAGVQSTLAVLLDQGYHRRHLPLERIATLIAAAPARRFEIANRGRIAPGYGADLALVDLDASFTLNSEDLLQRHPVSPYAGACFRGAPLMTIRRGELIYNRGTITAQTCGTLVRPTLT